MSVELEARTAELPAIEPVEPLEPQPTETGDQGEQPVNVLLTSVAIFLSTWAAGWMCSGIFRGGLAKVVALFGALIGVGTVALSYRTRRPSIVQYLALPAAVVVGALIVLPDASGGTANLATLVSEAIRTGGVAQPPIPFDPGWRFILVVLTALLGAASASLATGLNRPKVGIFIPVPLLFGASLLQPKEGTLVSIGVALVLFIGSLAVSYGVELAQEGATSGQFEARRLVRSVGVIAVLIAVLAGLSQVGFLFPEPKREQVIPPKKPEPAPPQPDRVLFTIQSPRNIPWRLGVLDVYDGQAWLLPPYDTARFLDVPTNGRVPADPSIPKATPSPTPGAFQRTTVDPALPKRESFQVTVTVADIEGHVIPTIAEAERIRRRGFEVQFDPRTQMLRLPEKRATKGMAYTIDAPAPPTFRELGAAPEPSAAIAEEYLEVPPPPDDVAALLDQAPPETNRFDRLQFVRNTFYQAVVASGEGQPKDVPPSRVSDMLAGKEATPYEITAAEVLLARWAGIPARIGYGFYGGTKPDPAGQIFEVHPKHGSTWLEAYFEGYGFVPIVGIPPKAKASISQAQKRDDPLVRPSEELALIVYVPVRRQNVQLLFVTVRYWAARVLPTVLALLLLWALVPGVAKGIRRTRRRRWGESRGLRERIAVAYAEFRDSAYDLNIGDPAATPLNFRRAIAADDEHDELAWLVTRGLWGDLSRDLRAEDAAAAEELSRSVTKRLKRAQGGLTRMLGFGARASLRDPYNPELPNLWPSWPAGALRRAVRRRLARMRPFRRLAPAGAALLVVLALVASGCAREEDPARASGAVELPERLVPESLDRFVFKHEPEVEKAFSKPGKASLLAGGRIYTIRTGNDIEGYIEIGAFKPGFGANRTEVNEGVRDEIGAGNFEPKRVGRDRIYVSQDVEQSFYLWFPPNGRYFQLLVARKGFADAERLFATLLAYQRGEEAAVVQLVQRGSAIDPRRGGDL